MTKSKLKYNKYKTYSIDSNSSDLVIDNKNIGILDPFGINNNPINGEPFSDNYKRLAKVWSAFPAYQDVEIIINTIKDNQVTLIISGTGSGKTVLLPKYLLHVFDYKKKIAVTLPKQIIAKSAAEFAAECLDVKLGKDVGYKYKGSDKRGYNKNNLLLYATDGTIVAKLLNDPLLLEFDGVIVDEAHERKVQIDFLLYLLRNTVINRPDFKLIIMSATINEHIFKDYFSKTKFKLINIGAKTNYPIESIYIKDPINQNQFLDKGYEIIKNIIENDDNNNNNNFKDILFFVTSSNEAKQLCERVLKDDLDAYCIEVYSGMNLEKQEIAQSIDLYKKHSGKNRKLVIATNVAESSLTIDGICYVIDSGFEIISYFDPIKQAKVLEKKLITQAQAKQRMGRTGRTGPGICYHLYTKNQFENEMMKFPEPTIRTSNIYDECLQLLALPTVQTVKELQKLLNELIEPPKEQYVKLAIDILTELDLIKNNTISELGKIVGSIQGDPHVILSILMGKIYNCGYELAAIFALTDAMKENISELFIVPQSNNNNSNNNNNNNNNDMQRWRALMNKFKDSQRNLAHSDGDHLSLLKIFTKYREMKHNKNEQKIGEFCYKYFIKKSVLDKAYIYYRKLKDSTSKDIKIPFEKNTDIVSRSLEDRILYCINFGFKNNIAHLNSTNTYDTKYADSLKLNQFNFLELKNKNLAKKLIYQSILISSGKSELNLVSKVVNF